MIELRGWQQLKKEPQGPWDYLYKFYIWYATALGKDSKEEKGGEKLKLLQQAVKHLERAVELVELDQNSKPDGKARRELDDRIKSLKDGIARKELDEAWKELHDRIKSLNGKLQATSDGENGGGEASAVNSEGWEEIPLKGRVVYKRIYQMALPLPGHFGKVLIW